MSTKSVYKLNCKKKFNKNTFDIIQFKKLLGKGVIKVWGDAIMDKKAMLVNIKKFKEKILSRSVKSVGLTGYVNNGIVFIFNGIDRMLAIGSTPYSDLKKNNIDIDVIITQYTKLSRAEINILTS
jgi:hypothetical protein